MLSVKIVAVGGLKEAFSREACTEYTKRLSAFCRVEVTEIKEAPLPDKPSEEQIASALEAEGAKILAALPQRSKKVALCVEGKQMPSERFASLLSDAAGETGAVCFVIGSSCGLSPKVKQACDTRLSFSEMTFPHQLMRVILFEQIYRGMMINSNRKYHK